jgi:hypothetical protein
LRGFVRFLYDFIVGDDWRIAAGVILALAVGAVLVTTEALPRSALMPLVAGAIMVVSVGSLLVGAARRR